MQKKTLGGGLLYKELDKRNFKFGGVFRMPSLSELPPSFVLEMLTKKNQYQSDYCTGYGGTLVSEVQEDTELVPEYQVAQTMRVSGKISEWGAPLEDMLKSFVEFGSLAKKDISPEKLEEILNSGRSYLANWNNWLEFDAKAAEHKKQSYWEISGPYDTFDNIRATIWANRAEEQAVVTGAMWRPEWGDGENGVIPSAPSEGGYGHCFVVKGFEDTIKNNYLVIQNSQGEEWGDKGDNYFDRETVNREFTFGAFTFKDMPRETAEYYVKNRIKIEDNWGVQLLKIINPFKLCQTRG